jgi:hypothetical protein
MKLSEVKTILSSVEAIRFKLPGNKFVPDHFHVTEVGLINKHFMDCGGTERKENVVSFQLWTANDYEHRLIPQKLQDIIALSERKLNIQEDYEVEVEYRSDTIGKYNLEFNGKEFMLTTKQTACLALDKCNIAEPEKTEATSCCAGNGCCS